MGYGYQHVKQCEQCADLHRPCEDQYMACGGCCGTPWHKMLGFDINTHHTCPEIKQFFKIRNSGVMECEEAEAKPASYDVRAHASAHSTRGAVEVEVKNETSSVK